MSLRLATLTALLLGCGPTVTATAGAPDAGTLTVPVPVPLAPRSLGVVTTTRPTFRWRLPAGLSGARVEVCRDRGCLTPVTAWEVVGDRGRPDAPLPAGVLFWRVTGRSAGGTPGSTPGGAPGNTPGNHGATWELSLIHI